MSVARKSASAETVANAFKDGAGEASTLYSSIQRTPAEKAADELAALEAEKKLVDARAALDPGSPAKVLAALEMDKKIADARLAAELSPTYELARLTAIAQAQKQYRDATEALVLNPNVNAVAQKAAFDADTALLSAEATNIETRIQLRDARRRLDH